MKNSKLIRYGLLVLGTVLFDVLFWKQGFGINTMIFSIFLISTGFYLYPESKKSIPALIVSCGMILISSVVIYHSSSLAVFVWFTSVFFFPAFLHSPNLKTFIFGFLQALFSYILVPYTLSKSFEKAEHKSAKNNKIMRFVRLVFVPLLVLYVFYWIFKFANPIFDKYTNEVFYYVNLWFSDFFKEISFGRIFFFIWGLSVTAWLIYKSYITNIAETEDKQSLFIRRKKKKLYRQVRPALEIPKLSLSLKNEFRSGLILIGLVNFLVLIINIIDINWVWFNFEYTDDINLTQFVHEGTYLLILSIILSMGIMMYFFRKNQNFFSKKKSLQIAAYIWIAQNVILLVSVLIRNLHYIHYFGLAYKRIGLFFFLAMVLFGLVTLIIKIKDVKSIFYLLKINSFALYIGFELFAIPDWDTIITKYNISSTDKDKIDYEFLLQMDQKTIPILYENLDLFKDKEYYYNWSWDDSPEPALLYLDNKRESFLQSERNKSWLSWNYADWKAYKYFSKK